MSATGAGAPAGAASAGGERRFPARIPSTIGCRRADDWADREGRRGTGQDLRYEVMYLLEAPDDTIPAFKDVWAGHRRLDRRRRRRRALELSYPHRRRRARRSRRPSTPARPRNIRVTDLADQVEEERWVIQGGAAPTAFDPGPVPRDGCRGGRERGRDRPDLQVARGPPHRPRRTVDEPVDRPDPGGRGVRSNPPRWCSCRTTRTSSLSRCRSSSLRPSL